MIYAESEDAGKGGEKTKGSPPNVSLWASFFMILLPNQFAGSLSPAPHKQQAQILFSESLFCSSTLAVSACLSVCNVCVPCCHRVGWRSGGETLPDTGGR